MRLRTWAIIAALLAGFALWIWIGMHDPQVPVTTYEVIPPGEADRITRLVRAATQVVVTDAKPDRFFKRDAHAKPHGCVHGTLVVNHDLETPLRHGVFSEPGKRYPAWVRFSNGTAAHDRDPDARGMAIKLMGVGGKKLLENEREERTQDFVMINYHTFFVSNLAEYEIFFDYQSAHRPIRYFFGENPFNPLDWHLHEFRHAASMLFQKVVNPLDAAYYSMTAYKLGPHNIKYSARPCHDKRAEMPKDRSTYYLRQAMVQRLNEGSACFDLEVQLQNPDENMPIEDPSIEWQERFSPFLPVARLTIPKQAFSSDAQNAFCEDLSFTPWHALPAHRPLGALNRSRKAVYEATSVRRHYRNQLSRNEPDPSSIPFVPGRQRSLSGMAPEQPQ